MSSRLVARIAALLLVVGLSAPARAAGEENYVIHAYTVRFNAYAGQQLKVGSARPEGDGGALVQSEIALPNSNQPPVKVDWRLSASGNSYKITDITVEGVSMALTERQEFASVIQRGGGQIDALLKVLRERAGQG